MSWAVKKAFMRAKVMYDEHELTRLMSKSSFLAEDPKRRISKGYCRDIAPIAHYLCGYWAGDPIRGLEVVQKGVDNVKGIRVNK